MIKSKEVSDPQSCLNKAGEAEPLFVLRAHDELAPSIVREWATKLETVADRRADPVDVTAVAMFNKAGEARMLADEMEEWQRVNGKKMPD